MATPSLLPPLPVAVPLLGAAVLAMLRKWLSRAAADSLCIGCAALTLVLAALLLRQSLAHTLVYWLGNWYPRGHMTIGIDLVADPIGAGLATLAAFLTLLAVSYSWRFPDDGGRRSQALMLILLAAMCGFSLTGDLFNMFVFFELMSTVAFALCGLKTRAPAPLQGAFNFAATNTVAAFMVLTGISLLSSVSGALNLAQIGAQITAQTNAAAGHAGPAVLFACALLFCGFFTKAAIAPFHFWLPDAQAVAPTQVCVIFASIMVELGLYAVVRLHATVFTQALAPHALRLRCILVALGVITVVWGGVMAYAQHHVRRLLAFSTISHLGLMLVALALGTPLAIAGFFTYLLGHALVISALFFVAGIVLHRLRTISEPMLFGNGRALPFTAAVWFLASLGLAGCPLFLTMQGQRLVSSGADALGWHWVAYIFLFTGTLTGAAALRFGMHTFLGWGEGSISDDSAQIGELPETRDGDDTTYWYQIAPPAVCVAAAIALVFFAPLRAQLQLTSSHLLSQAQYIGTVYGHPTAALPATPAPASSVWPAALRGLLATALALLLACSSVFRRKLPRRLRVGAFLEGPLLHLRSLQSGHPGDYVLWITIGTAGIGCAFLVLLR